MSQFISILYCINDSGHLLHQVSAAKFVYGCAIDAAMWNPNCLFDSLQAGVMLPEK